MNKPAKTFWEKYYYKTIIKPATQLRKRGSLKYPGGTKNHLKQIYTNMGFSTDNKYISFFSLFIPVSLLDIYEEHNDTY